MESGIPSSVKGPGPAAEWRGVSRRFDGSGPASPAALDDFHLTVQPGEFLTLLGPSGCGKTTALRLLSGLDTPDAGQVFLAGQDVTALPPHRREVNQVFQSYALFPHLSVADNIAFGLRMKRVPAAEIKTRVARVVELLALDGLTARRPDMLSGGQRQRVALARALVCEPKVLLLDEPLSALDARLRAQVRGELRVLQRRIGMTFVFVTHDQEEALTLSDRVAVMRGGRLAQVGSPEAVYRRPDSRFVAEFVGEANLLPARIVGTEGANLVCQLTGGAGERRLLAAAPASLPTGEVLLLIRPEHLQLSLQPTGGSGLAGEVEEKVFRGADVMVTLRLPAEQNGRITRVRVQLSSELVEPLSPGSVGYVEIDPGNIVLLSAAD